MSETPIIGRAGEAEHSRLQRSRDTREPVEKVGALPQLG